MRIPQNISLSRTWMGNLEIGKTVSNVAYEDKTVIVIVWSCVVWQGPIELG